MNPYRVSEPPPLGRLIRTHHGHARALAVCAVILGAFLAAPAISAACDGAAAFRSVRPALGVCAALFLPLVVLCVVRAIRQAGDRVEIYDLGLLVYRRRQVRRLDWIELAEVRFELAPVRCIAVTRAGEPLVFSHELTRIDLLGQELQKRCVAS
jgi:hypothetical protein